MKVRFIGAGPGDPELLTIKANRLIRGADVIIYAGSLVNKEILKLAPAQAGMYDSSRMSLEDIFRIMRKAKLDNKDVVRIHSGDPSIYGALQEQISWCEKEGIDYDITPGVSSLFAGAASLRQELTLPGMSQTVIITRLSGRTKVPEKESLRLLSQAGATMVIFLSIDKIDDALRQLRHGYDDDTPVAVVSRASWPDEKVLRGTLKDIVEKVKRMKIDKQALVYVGPALKRKGFKKSRLYDKGFSHSFRKKKGRVPLEDSHNP